MNAETQMTLPAVPEAPQQTPMLAMMERLATNPDLPVEKLEKLLDMQLKIRAIEAEAEFNAAMSRVQAALPKVLRQRKNEQTGSLYATHESIAEAIKPVYTAEGFSASFSEGKTDKPDHVRVLGELMHRDGHKKNHYYVDIAIDKTGIKGNDNKTMTHAEGSSFTYGRRYLTCLMFDVATGNDTDGNRPGVTLLINADQVTVINDKIAEAQTNKAQFLSWLKVDAVEKILAADYKRAVEKLDGIAAKKASK